jgi:glycine betaine/choline ABC-type transport system substrate-binding protein
MSQSRRFLRAAIAVITSMAVLSLFVSQSIAVQAKAPIKIAARNFTEELIAGNLYSELLTAHGIANTLDTSFVDESTIFGALTAGQVDLVPDYLGNGLVDLKEAYTPGTSVASVYNSVNQQFANKGWKVKLLAPAYKFNDQNVFVTTKANSSKWGLTTLSGLAANASKIRLEIMQECVTRSDCLPTFNKVYKPGKWAKIADPVNGTTPNDPPFYGDLLGGKFDVVQGYGTTDAQISHYHLVALKDDKHMFPPDQMTPFIGSAVATANPAIATWLKKLDKDLTNADFAQMNAQVTFGKKLPSTVAHKFLKAQGLL